MRRRRDSGFAMLFVLLMAGLVAITLYKALPRAAFEAEREKEQSLIDRGSQYKRAIQLYVRQNKRWPAKIEDLENTNGKRYLRKRYVDPMTGKDEWRPVHVGPNGVLTDSLIKPAKKDGASTYSNNFITELGGVGSAPDAPGATNPGLRKRPSDQLPSGPGDGGQGGQAGNPSQAGQPPQPGNPSQSNQPPQPNGPNYPPGSQLPNTGQTANTGLPQQLQGGGGNGAPTGVYPGPPVNSQAGGGGGISVIGGVGGGYSTAPGANGPAQPPNQNGLQGTLQGQNTGIPGQAGQPGQQGQPGQPGQQGQPGGANGTPQNAAQLIQGLLTSPRPGGPPGTIGSGVGQVQGGGIAGFASKFEGEGIKIYNEQKEIQKWEFVYDMSKDAAITGGQQAIPQPPGPNSTNGFGSTSGTSGTQGAASSTATPSTATPVTQPPVVH
jgi:type II secretory pathway pseudopilin PulG